MTGEREIYEIVRLPSAFSRGRETCARLQRMKTTGRLAWVVVDTLDPSALASFWRQLLGVDVEEETGTSPAGPRYVILKPQDEKGFALTFQWVPEDKVTKNR